MTSRRGAVRRLALALFISATWSEAAYVALAFNLYRRTGSGLWVAMVFLLTLGVPGFFTPVGGVIADRFDRKRVMVVSEAFAAAAFSVLIVTERPVAMLIVAFVAAMLHRPFGPALSAAVPNLAEHPDHLARTNSTISLGYRVGTVLGATIGGVLFEAYGPRLVFGLNAASFVISALLIASIRTRFSAEATSEDEETFRGMTAGFAFVRRDRTLVALLVAWALIWLAVDIVLVAEPALVTMFHAGAVGYGLLGAAWGVGSVVGTVIGRRVPVRLEVVAVMVETVGTAVALAVVALAPSITFALLGVGVVAVFDGLGEVAGYSYIQRRTPDAVRGRVLASYSTAGMIGNTVGFVAGGALLDVVGARGIYGIGAGASALATVPVASVAGPARASSARSRQTHSDGRSEPE
jgi:MFS family permease